jgi:hypothetical protein
MLETKMRDPDPPPEIEAIVPTEPAEDAETAPDTELEETEPSKPEPTPSVASIARRATQFLYETYVGEEYAPCFSRPSNSSRLMKVYDYNETVTPQCGTRDDSLESLGTIWLLTIDWCYVDDALMDPNLIDCEFWSPVIPYFGKVDLTRMRAAAVMRGMLHLDVQLSLLSAAGDLLEALPREARSPSLTELSTNRECMQATIFRIVRHSRIQNKPWTHQ